MFIYMPQKGSSSLFSNCPCHHYTTYLYRKFALRNYMIPTDIQPVYKMAIFQSHTKLHALAT
jgi:hypothetical protein